MGSSWFGSFFVLRFGFAFFTLLALLRSILGRSWGHFRPSWGLFSSRWILLGLFFLCFAFVFACRFSTFRCSPFSFSFSIRRCFFLIVSFQRCSPSRPRMRTVSHEHSRGDLLFIDVRLWLFDLRIIHFRFSTCRCSLEVRPCGLRAARLE